jgi:SAM-dependent methyltransferase
MTAANEEQRDFWNGPGGETWIAEQERLDRQLGPLGRAAMWALAPRTGEQVLDLGCGAGTTTLALAEAVGPDGRVVGLDLSEAFIAAAQRREAPAHVTFVAGDAQTVEFAQLCAGSSRRDGPAAWRGAHRARLQADRAHGLLVEAARPAMHK